MHRLKDTVFSNSYDSNLMQATFKSETYGKPYTTKRQMYYKALEVQRLALWEVFYHINMNGIC